MGELLLKLAFISFCFVLLLLSYIPSIIVGLKCHEDSKNYKLDIKSSIIGILLAIFNYIPLYLSIATISHGEYSKYGFEFSSFYLSILPKTICATNVILLILWLISIFKKNDFLWKINLTYQITLLVLLFVPNGLFSLFLYFIRVIDLSMHIFAYYKEISVSVIDIKKDLMFAKYSTTSYFFITIFYFSNNLLAILMMSKFIKPKKTTNNKLK